MSSNDRLAYLVGPVMADNGLGAGFYMVQRTTVGRITYFVQETILPMDEDDAFTLTEILPDGKPGRVFTAPELYAADVAYDFSQTYEGRYDFCRCGAVKAMSARRCPICRIERQERRRAHDLKVIAAYKRSLRRKAREAKRAAKQAARQAQEQAEFDSLRPRQSFDEVVTQAAGKSWVALGMAMHLLKDIFPRRPKEPVQLALPMELE